MSKRFAVVVAAMTAAFALAIVFAAWLATGTGNGYAKATSAQPLTTSAVNGSALTTGLLYPGKTDGDVRITINNPNPYPVHVTSVSQTPSSSITADGGTGTCTTTGVTFTNQTGLTLDVAAGGSETITLSGAVAMSNASDDGCQGTVFTIPVTLSGQSNVQ